MFRYELKDKFVILAIAQDFLPNVKPFGIDGSPVFAKVFDQEEGGLWLETHSFTLCPLGVPKVYDASGTALCHAHIYIPDAAILSVVVFPGGPSAEVANDPSLNKIGFHPAADSSS